VQWENAAWFDFGLTYTLKAQNQFRVSSQSAGASYAATDVFAVDQRVKIISNNATVYGTVSTLSSSSTAVLITVTPDSGTLTSTVTSVAASIIKPTNSPVPTSQEGSNYNFIFNSDFEIWPFGTSITSASSPNANNDDTYVASNWILLSDGNDTVDVTRETAATLVPDGAGSAIKLEVETANRKFGILFPIENEVSDRLVGSTVSASFEARNAASDDNTDVLKCAILSWDSTANSITSDVVSAWNADLTTPTFATNWTAENTPSNLSLTQSYQQFTVNSVDMDTSGITNIGLFIWCDNADGAVDDAIYISKVKLEISSTATAWQPIPYEENKRRCERFIKTSFPFNIAPQQNYGVQTGEHIFPAIQAGGGVYRSDKIIFDPPMLGAATITFYNPAAANANIRDETLGADGGAASVTQSDIRGFNVQSTGNASSSATNAFGIHYLAYNVL